MAIIPKNESISFELNDKMSTHQLRGHLGLSMIGADCLRVLQYNHYWAFEKKFNSRIQRLFNVGNDSEAVMIADLAKVGITVFDEQKEIRGTAGHWMGHIDGIGSAHDSRGNFLIEFKTHNDSSFKDLRKNKVQKSKPMHYGQMQTYMGHLLLTQSLYMALNKNTSEYYIEWVEFDEEYFRDSKRKEIEVISADTLLPRIGTGKPTWFGCKMCDAKEVCFNKKKPMKNCRTCGHVDVLDDGVWSCTLEKNPMVLSEKTQRIGCDGYKLGEMFNE